MRIDFSPRLQMNPLAFAQMGLGAIQGIAGLIQNKRATKQLENMQSPTYNQNKSILDFYNKSLAKYNVNPYQTDLYRMQEQQANRGLASGLGALGSRGMANANVNNLVQGRSDNLLKAGAMAEERQGTDLNRLGQAANMKAGEDRMAFQVNQQDPFERKYNLKAMKAGGGADIMNSGISNIFGGASTMNQMSMLDKMYGGNNSKGVGSYMASPNNSPAQTVGGYQPTDFNNRQLYNRRSPNTSYRNVLMGQ